MLNQSINQQTPHLTVRSSEHVLLKVSLFASPLTGYEIKLIATSTVTGLLA